jgi:hypothetical protein
MKDYAMFSPRGNELVDGVVVVAQREGWDWAKTRSSPSCSWPKLTLRAAAEAMDTAVREEVWAALNRG